MDTELKIKLIPQQEEFLLSEKRFPAFCAAIGTGKTYMLLLKAVRYCLTNPNSLGLIVRKQFTDLHDSTLNDFRKYFGVDVDSHKEVLFENGSKLMFRHGAEIEVLKNINLDFCGIEQAEEFEDDTQFSYLRDRLRGKAGTYQQMFIIANADGHNWIWRKWVNLPPSDEFHLITATTFDNAINLPKAFMDDQMARQKDEPRHYRRMVLNCFDEDLSDDLVFKTTDITKSSRLNYPIPNFTRYVAGLDVGRYGDDASCLTILCQVGVQRWRQVFMEEKKGWSTVQVAGWAKDTWKLFPFDIIGVDDIGVGGGVTDLLGDSNRYSVAPFIANEKANGNCPYANKKSQGYFRLEEFISKEYLQILDDMYLHAELSTIKYYYRQDAVKYIVGKEEMKRQGHKSPNKAEALMIAMFYADYQDVSEMGFEVIPGEANRKNFQQYAITD
jgi:Phage terminase large subunit